MSVIRMPQGQWGSVLGNSTRQGCQESAVALFGRGCRNGKRSRWILNQVIAASSKTGLRQRVDTILRIAPFSGIRAEPAAG